MKKVEGGDYSMEYMYEDQEVTVTGTLSRLLHLSRRGYQQALGCCDGMETRRTDKQRPRRYFRLPHRFEMRENLNKTSYLCTLIYLS